MKSLFRLAWLIAPVLLISGPVQAQSGLKVIVPLQDYDQHRSSYAISVLKLALEHSGHEYELQAHITAANQGRNLRDLADGKAVFNVMWTGTSRQREEDLLPVRFPLTRGLLGIRLFIIRKDRQAEFDTVTTLEGLKELLAGQGLNWPDTKILRGAGLSVEETRYENMFRLLRAGRIDYFPRGANEPFTELDAVRDSFPDLAVEHNLAVAYPFDFFFFVNKQDKVLHKAIRGGLLTIYRNGQFLQNFEHHPDIKAIRNQAGLDKRRIFVINNPLLTPETRELPKDYWEPVFSTLFD